MRTSVASRIHRVIPLYALAVAVVLVNLTLGAAAAPPNQPDAPFGQWFEGLKIPGRGVPC